MTKYHWTLLALAGALGAYEIITLINEAPGDTISEVIWALTDRWPVIALLFGLLMGHLFWPRRLSDATAAQEQPPRRIRNNSDNSDN